MALLCLHACFLLLSGHVNYILFFVGRRGGLLVKGLMRVCMSSGDPRKRFSIHHATVAWAFVS